MDVLCTEIGFIYIDLHWSGQTLKKYIFPILEREKEQERERERDLNNNSRVIVHDKPVSFIIESWAKNIQM